MSSPLAAERPAKMPWQVNKPIVVVKKELYRKHPSPGASAWVNLEYVGPKLELLETDNVMASSDMLTDRRWRFSADNGKHWSDFQPLAPASLAVHYKGVKVVECEGPRLYDPEGGVLVETWLRQIPAKGASTTYWRLSHDFGKTWGPPKMLRYEPGDDFDPNNPQSPGYLSTNQGFFGNSIISRSDGTLMTVLAEANAPGVPQSPPMHSLCFVGRWNAEANDYRWTPGKPVAISPKQSSRGLLEPEVAELKDGRLLVIWRGSNTSTTPGRKFYSVSTDGGMTLSPVKELKYDDGSSFYSPSSFHRLVRHSTSGKLYWVGNISATPPQGNSPRYPLVVAEVSETIPALKKHTVTLVDDKRPDQTDALQLSNFALLENRETHAFDLYMTLLGEFPGSIWNADCYKYVITVIR
jgi:hypothetical protein